MVNTIRPESSEGNQSRSMGCSTIYFTTTFWYYGCAGGECSDPQMGHFETTMYYICEKDIYTDFEDPHFGGGGGTGGSDNPSDNGTPGDRDQDYFGSNYSIDEWNFYNSLNEKEKLWFRISKNWIKLPFVHAAMENANSSSTNLYQCQLSDGTILLDEDGTNQNAYKHAFWIDQMACMLGPSDAFTIGENHEFGENNIASAMDLYNNDIGLNVYLNECGGNSGSCTCNVFELMEKVKAAIDGGRGR
jgi:hypothetical protein